MEDCELEFGSCINISTATPKIGETYFAYQDGDFKKDKQYSVKILDIIPYGDASIELLQMWNTEKNKFADLYPDEPDVFVLADTSNTYPNGERIFIQDNEGIWWSFGELTGAVMDVTGTITKTLK